MKDLLKKITDNNILLEVIDGQLRVFANNSNPDPALISEIKHNKEKLQKFLSGFQAKNNHLNAEGIPTAAAQEGYPLSSSQYRLWLLNQFGKGSEAYNMPGIYTFRGELDLVALEQGFIRLYERHESLRTVFKENVSGEVLQYVKPVEEAVFKVVHHDCRTQSAEFIRERVAETCNAPFDIQNAPLLRVHLFRTAEQEWVLAYVMPHIVSDGWSMDILIKELISLYHAYSSNSTYTLAPLPFRYKDFAVWQQLQLVSSRYKAERDYWLEQFQGELPILELPADFKRPVVKTYNGATVRHEIQGPVINGLQQLCQHTGSTLFMALMAAVNTLLYRYTDQEDIILGTPVAGRERWGLDKIVGFFVNTLAIRNFFSGQDSFRQLLAKVQKNCLSAFEHQAYPFDELLEQLSIEREAGRHPLFDVMVNLQHSTGLESIKLPDGLEIVDYEGYSNDTSKFDLTFNFSAREDRIILNLEYNSDIYTSKTISKLVNHFTALLIAAVECQDKPIQDINYLTEAETEKLLGIKNRVNATYPRHETIVSLFEKQVELAPESTALIFEHNQISYGQLNEQANRLADFLRIKYQIQPDDLVGMMLERSEWMVMTIMGILKSGGAYVPVDINYPQERINYMLDDSNCKVVIDQDVLNEFFENESLYQSFNQQNEVKPNHLAYVIYTSGTTGQPKGNLIEHHNVVQLLKSNPALFDFNEKDVWTLFHSYCFDFSVWEIFGPLLSGGSLVVVKDLVAKDPGSFLALLRDKKVTVLNQTPTSFYNLIQKEMEETNAALQIRYVIFGGEALNPRYLQPWKNKYPQTRLINMYGITETTVHVTFKEITQYEIASGLSNIGKPIPMLSCYVLDQRGHLLPHGISGELYVSGDGVARGYLNKPELSASRFMPNPFCPGQRMYRSGDKVKVLENGEMVYEGRLDNQVKIRGYRIELGEIESAICRYDAVDGAVVVIRTTAEGEKELIAYVKSADEVNITSVRQYLSGIIPSFMMPHYFVMLKEWPLTANGKINHSKLPSVAGADQESGVEYVAPGSLLEKKLVGIFSEILKVPEEKISLNDHFFSLGGDSIKAIRIIGKIRDELDIKLTVGKLYEYPVIRELAEWMAHNEDDSLYRMKEEGLLQIGKFREIIEEEDQKLKVLPRDYEDIYPLTTIEQGMIYSSMIRPEEPIYYDQFEFIIDIDDLAAFETVVGELANRHTILRTKYYVKSFSRPAKVVLNNIVLPIVYEDFTMLDETKQRDAVRNLLACGQASRLNFDDELFWNFQVCHLSGSKYAVIWSFHHSALDGWSVSLFNTELTQLMAKNGKTELTPLKHSYKDYCAILLGRKKDEQASRYWQHLLEGYTRNKLPFNYKGLPVSEKSGMKRVSKTIDLAVLGKLDEVASKHQLSFKSICLAAHLYLLHVLCAEKDIVTGVVTHDRPSIEDGEKILGCFLNTIPIRIKFDELSDILSLLNTTDQFLKTAKPNEIHLSEIAGILNERSTSMNPFFDTLMNFTDFHAYEHIHADSSVRLASSGWDVIEVDDSTEMTNTLFDVEVDKTLDRFKVKIKFMSSFFEDEQVKYALDLYVRILEQIASDVSTPLSSIELLSATEKQDVLVDFNNTRVAYAHQKNLHSLFEEQVLRTPEHVALRQDGKDITYQELNVYANQLAYFLSAFVKKGDNVGLLVTRSFDMIAGMYAILKTGGAYVPIDPDYPADRQEYILSNSGASKLITNLPEVKLNGFKDEDVIDINQLNLGGFSEDNPVLDVKSNQLAYTIYTSGSTGRPKGVMIEHHAVINLISWVNNTFNVGTKDRLLFITSMCFDLSVYDIFGILSTGGTIVIARNEEVQQIGTLKTLLFEEKITFWNSVPSTLNYLVTELEAAKDTFRQEDLRIAFLSGDWIPVSLPERSRRFFPALQVISLGGATEGTVWSNYFPVSTVEASWSSIPYGKPIDNNTFYILDDHMRPVPKGVTGELYIGGVGVATGYANDADKTAASFVPDPFTPGLGGMMYKTGDLGRMLSDGNMEFLGRKDFQVKIRGFRVELGEIESILQRLEQVREAVVDVRKDSHNLNQLCAYLVPNGQIDINAIRKALQEKLPSYMIPFYFRLLDKLPLTSNGKINRKALPDPLTDEMDAGAYEAPKTDLEIKIAGIWTSILNIDKLGLKDDFFTMGANSLSVGAFVNRFQRETDFSISIRTVFMHPNIESLAAEIEKMQWANSELLDVENSNDTENFTI